MDEVMIEVVPLPVAAVRGLVLFAAGIATMVVYDKLVTDRHTHTYKKSELTEID